MRRLLRTAGIYFGFVEDRSASPQPPTLSTYLANVVGALVAGFIFGELNGSLASGIVFGVGMLGFWVLSAERTRRQARSKRTGPEGPRRGRPD